MNIPWKHFFIKNARLLGSTFIFISVMTLLGFPYSNWGFYGDDFGNILNTQIHGFGDLIRFIKFGNVAHLFFPSNFVTPPVHFFNVLYRPLVFFMFGFLSMLFGVNAKAYFLTVVMIHAINSVFLFNVFSFFVEYLWAFLGALLFAFHPMLFGWFGWPAALPYQIDLFVIITLFFLFKKFVETNRYFYLIVSVLIYFLSLFMHETLIVLPALIAIAMLLLNSPRLHFKKIVGVFFTFISGAIFYLSIRLYCFPFQKTLFHNEFLPRIWNGLLMKLFYYVYALPGFYVFFQNHFWLRCAMTLFFLMLLPVLFIFNTQKKLLLFLIFCVASLSWCQMYNYCNRYLYVAIPFFILFVLIDINYFKSPWSYLNRYLPKVLGVILALAVVHGVFFVKKDLAVREERTIRINTAFDELIKNSKISGRIIYFIDIPYNYFLSGVAQALWLRGCNVDLPIYSYEVGLG